MNSVAVHGNNRSPESSGPCPSEICWNWAMKNTALSSAQDSRKLEEMPALKARDANRRGGSIGWRLRRSKATKAISSAIPAPSVPSTSALPQPASFERISPQTMPSAAPATSTRPGPSSGVRGP